MVVISWWVSWLVWLVGEGWCDWSVAHHHDNTINNTTTLQHTTATTAKHRESLKVNSPVFDSFVNAPHATSYSIAVASKEANKKPPLFIFSSNRFHAGNRKSTPIQTKERKPLHFINN
jgi:hypothetical protein